MKNQKRWIKKMIIYGKELRHRILNYLEESWEINYNPTFSKIYYDFNQVNTIPKYLLIHEIQSLAKYHNFHFGLDSEGVARIFKNKPSSIQIQNSKFDYIDKKKIN